MALQIAETSFTSGPDNKAATVDVYKDPPKRPTNATPGIAPDGIKTFGGLKLGGAPVSELLKEVAKGYASNGSIDLDGALERASGITGVTKGAMRSRGGEVTNEILKAFGFYNSDLGKNLDTITKQAGGDSFEKFVMGGRHNVDVLTGDVKSTLKSFKDIDGLQKLSDFIGSISGDNEFIKIFNLSDSLAVFQALNKVAVEFSLPGVMDKLIEKLDAEDQRAVVVGSSRDIYAISDMDYIETMLGHASGEELLGSNPTLLKDILANFRSTSKYPLPDKATAEKLDSLLKRIRVKWMYSYIEGQALDVFDLDIFRTASPFARECFLSNDMYVAPLAIAGTYDAIPFNKTVNGRYPYLDWK